MIAFNVYLFVKGDSNGDNPTLSSLMLQNDSTRFFVVFVKILEVILIGISNLNLNFFYFNLQGF